jgi:hypothetical protein
MNIDGTPPIATQSGCRPSRRKAQARFPSPHPSNLLNLPLAFFPPPR